MPDSCFCEAVGEGLVRQPANTWSSLTFCVAALVMLVEWLRQRQTARSTAVEGALFVLAVFLVGVTSAFYHASLTFLGQTLDVQSMYLVVVLALAVNVDAWRAGQPRRFLATYLGGNVALGVLLITVPVLRRFAFAGVIAAVIASEVALRRAKRRDWAPGWLWLAAGVQGVAFVIWVLDGTHVLCDPGSLLQGHAAWHTLGAFASFGLWRYFRGPGA